MYLHQRGGGSISFIYNFISLLHFICVIVESGLCKFLFEQILHCKVYLVAERQLTLIYMS